MNRDLYQRVKVTFQAACRLSEAERACFLVALERQAPEVAVHVEALLLQDRSNSTERSEGLPPTQGTNA